MSYEEWGPGRPHRKAEGIRFARAVCRRLRETVQARQDQYRRNNSEMPPWSANGLAERFAEYHGLASHVTVKQWFYKNEPPLPNAFDLARIAASENLSLDWLITGRGHAFRDVTDPSESLPTRVKNAVIDALASDYPRDELEASVPEGDRLLEFLAEKIAELSPPIFLPEGQSRELEWWRQILAHDIQYGTRLSGVSHQEAQQVLALGTALQSAMMTR